MKKETIVAFDFDGTITQKDTLIEFIKFTKGHIRLYFGVLVFSPMFIAMKLKMMPNWKVKQLFFSCLYKNIPIEQFTKWCIDFSVIIDRVLYPKAVEAIKLHKKCNDKVIIISASIENWIKPWADKMGIDIILATKIEADEKGFLTGRFLTKNCYGQEKVDRLLEQFPKRNNYKFIAYGDSRGDKELIEFADEGFFKKFN